MNTRNWQVRCIQALSVLGIVLAYYLYLYHRGTIPSVCAIDSAFNCDVVSGPTAEFSSIGPIPVALIGLIGYIFIFALTWISDFVDVIRDNMRELLLGVIGFAFLFSAGLTALEAFVLNAWCQWCLVSAGIITLMFLLSISYLRSDG